MICCESLNDDLGTSVESGAGLAALNLYATLQSIYCVIESHLTVVILCLGYPSNVGGTLFQLFPGGIIKTFSIYPKKYLMTCFNHFPVQFKIIYHVDNPI